MTGVGVDRNSLGMEHDLDFEEHRFISAQYREWCILFAKCRQKAHRDQTREWYTVPFGSKLIPSGDIILYEQ